MVPDLPPPPNPVLLVHGIDDTGRVFDALAPKLKAAGWHVETIDMRPNNGDESLVVLAEQVRDKVSRMRAATGASRVDLVAFSLGGIVSRYYLQRLGGAHQVQRFVTLSSPHAGTLMGYARWNRGATELRRGSAFLADLNRDWSKTAEQVRVTSIWTPLDLMIVPANSSELPGARNLTVPVLLHPLMLVDNRCHALVLEALQD
ncbi:Extracellular esterase EstB precursor [compost metagenome]